ncbi:hypothetical protein IWQ49_006588 [Labrenzia sp. EL_126]|nr:hypothetical protein [Labrenzia sp. EL_126]
MKERQQLNDEPIKGEESARKTHTVFQPGQLPDRALFMDVISIS